MWKVKIIDTGFSFNREIYIFREVGDGMEIIQGDTVQFVKKGEATSQTPTMLLQPEMLQALAEGLAEVGYKAKT